jgi:DNA-binding NtrC family response regulator
MRHAVVCLDPHNSCGQSWKEELKANGFALIETRAISEVISHPEARIAIICAEDNTGSSLSSVSQLRQLNRNIPVILLVREGSEELAVAALRARVDDYFHIPAETGSFLKAVQAKTAAPRTGPENTLIGTSAAMQQTKARLARVSVSNSSVLITGETGTGKEMAASLIHYFSNRSAGPFVCVNCAAIPDALIESELFGYERGAFTGASMKKSGWLETAHRGTLFLDEVGDLSPMAQAKLLRVIENKSYYRLGGHVSIAPDVRFIAATHRNLEQMTTDGGFRQDLYYRLNVARVHLPPLRERLEDIPLLLHHYIQEFTTRSGDLEFTDEVWQCLMAHDWPGNVRELKNILESLAMNAEERTVRRSDLPAAIRGKSSDNPSAERSERDQILAALLCTKWNKSKAAQQLRWSRMTLYRKLSTYRLVAPPPAKSH